MSTSAVVEDQEKQRLQRAFLPSRAEAVGLFAFSAVFLALGSGLRYIRADDNTVYGEAADYMDTQLRQLLASIDKYLGSILPTMLFWMFIGMIVYVICWFIWSIYSAYKDDIQPTKGMVMPSGVNTTKLLRDSIAHFLIRVLSFILLVGWIFMLSTEIIPLASANFLGSNGQTVILQVLVSIGSVLLLAASIFVCSALMRCMLLRDRVFTH